MIDYLSTVGMYLTMPSLLRFIDNMFNFVCILILLKALILSPAIYSFQHPIVFFIRLQSVESTWKVDFAILTGQFAGKIFCAHIPLSNSKSWGREKILEGALDGRRQVDTCRWHGVSFRWLSITTHNWRPTCVCMCVCEDCVSVREFDR